MNNDAVSIAILAGGHSSRMGRDKAELRIDNQSLLERTTRLALEFSAQVAIVGREIPANWPHNLTVSFMPDAIQNAGPLSGLVSALQWAQSEEIASDSVLILPCDLPQLNADALQWILSQPRATMGVASTRASRIEPLFAIYGVQVLADAEARLQNNRRSLHGLIETLYECGELALVDLPDELHPALFNCNTPEDWQRATDTNRT